VGNVFGDDDGDGGGEAGKDEEEGTSNDEVDDEGDEEHDANDGDETNGDDLYGTEFGNDEDEDGMKFGQEYTGTPKSDLPSSAPSRFSRGLVGVTTTATVLALLMASSGLFC